MLSILLVLTLIPTIVLANEVKEITFNINFNNIKINIKHKVEFDSNGGTPTPEKQEVKYLDKVEKPTTDPSKTKYEFDGWLDEQGNLYDFENEVSKNMTLAAKWTGTVGLMSVSDYGFATSGDNTITRERCLNTDLNAVNYWTSSTSGCANNNWLQINGRQQWTMSRKYYNGTYVNYIHQYGGVWEQHAYSTLAYTYIRPVVYLKTEVNVTGCEGIKTNPFRIGFTND